MLQNDAHSVDYGKKPSHLVRGGLMDALEDKVDFLGDRAIPRHWRDHGTHCMINNVRRLFTKFPELQDPATTRQKQWVDTAVTAAGSPVRTTRAAQPKQKTLLSYCKILFYRHLNSPRCHVVWL
jgi:hypothetical protein